MCGIHSETSDIQKQEPYTSRKESYIHLTSPHVSSEHPVWPRKEKKPIHTHWRVCLFKLTHMCAYPYSYTHIRDLHTLNKSFWGYMTCWVYVGLLCVYIGLLCVYVGLLCVTNKRPTYTQQVLMHPPNVLPRNDEYESLFLLINMQKGPTYTQKGPTNARLVKYPHRVHFAHQGALFTPIFSIEAYVHSQEQYIHPKDPYVHSKASYVTQKSPM